MRSSLDVRSQGIRYVSYSAPFLGSIMPRQYYSTQQVDCEDKRNSHASLRKTLFYKDPCRHHVPVVGMNQVRQLSCAAHRGQISSVTSDGSGVKGHFLDSSLSVV